MNCFAIASVMFISATGLLAGGAFAQDQAVNAPAVKQGSRWIYKSGEGKRTLTVTDVDSDGTITAKIETPSLGGLQVKFTKEWDPLMEPDASMGDHINYRRYSPAICLMPAAPWMIGKEWSCDANWTEGSFSGTVTVKGKIEAMEKLTVPAGTFDALRIKENVGGNDSTLWYAPTAQQFVKINASDPNYSMELTSFELK